MPHRGIEPVSAACRSDALPTELYPHRTSRTLTLTKSFPGAHQHIYIHLGRQTDIQTGILADVQTNKQTSRFADGVNVPSIWRETTALLWRHHLKTERTRHEVTLRDLQQTEKHVLKSLLETCCGQKEPVMKSLLETCCGQKEHVMKSLPETCCGQKEHVMKSLPETCCRQKQHVMKLLLEAG